MRAMWTGAISFGLVNVPVKLYTATENHDLQFRQVRASDGSRIKMQRIAEADGEEVAYSELAKGYETEDGRMVMLTDEDLAALPSRSSKEIAVEKFVPAEQVDPRLFDKIYYVEPQKTGAKPYALLREVLEDSDRMAVVTVSVRTRLTMALLRVVDNVICLQTLLWPDEVRDVAELDNLELVQEPTEAEVKMANLLVESMAADFEPNDYEDDYKMAVQAIVEAKLAGGDVSEALPKAASGEDDGKVVDLLAALQRSVDAASAKHAANTASDAADEDADAEDDAEPAKKTSTRTRSSGTKSTSAKSTGKASKGTDATDRADDKPAAKTSTRRRTAKKAS